MCKESLRLIENVTHTYITASCLGRSSDMGLADLLEGVAAVQGLNKISQHLSLSLTLLLLLLRHELAIVVLPRLLLLLLLLWLSIVTSGALARRHLRGTLAIRVTLRWDLLALELIVSKDWRLLRHTLRHLNVVSP